MWLKSIYEPRRRRDPEEALALPAEDRAALAESLLASLDALVHDDAEAAWARNDAK